MRLYFKNITPFRALFLFMLLAALATSLFEYVRQVASSSDETANRKKLHEALSAGVEEIGEHLASVESVGLNIVERFERGDHADEYGRAVGRILTETLEAAPAYVEGVGINYQYAGSRETAFRTRSDSLASGRAGVYAGARNERQNRSAREINLERQLGWNLTVESNDGDIGNFSFILSISAREGDVSGESLVKADLDWLAHTLARLEQLGRGRFFCITPGEEMLWLVDGMLHFTTDFMRDKTPEPYLTATAGQVLAGMDGGDGFEAVDVLGSRWRLVAVVPPVYGLLHAAIITAIFMLAALVLEVTFRGVSGSEFPRTGTSLIPRDNQGPSGLSTRVHEMLFKYRLTNPDKERLNSELRVARQIQFSLLPATFPEHSEWREYDLFSSLHPAREVGGDYYDFFSLGPNRLVLAVGDVSGKGMPAALYMAVCRTAFRAMARLAEDPGDLLSRVNDMLIRDNKSGRYVTVACFFIDMPSGRCQYSIAGHPAPLLCRAGDQEGELLDHPRETIIGLQAGVKYPVGEIQFHPGDTLLLYTDGVTEAQGDSGGELEYDGLFGMFKKVAGAGSCREIIENLEAEVGAFMGESEQRDDMTLLALRYWGPGGQRLSREPKRSSLRMIATKTSEPIAQAKRHGA